MTIAARFEARGMLNFKREVESPLSASVGPSSGSTTTGFKKVNSQNTPTWLPHAKSNQERRDREIDGTERLEKISHSQRKFAAQFSLSSLSSDEVTQRKIKEGTLVGGSRWVTDKSGQQSSKQQSSGEQLGDTVPNLGTENKSKKDEAESLSPQQVEQAEASSSSSKVCYKGDQSSSPGKDEKSDKGCGSKVSGSLSEQENSPSASPTNTIKKEAGVVKGPWTKEEDQVVIDCIAQNITKWSEIAERIEGRIGKQCRERWFNHLDPSLKKSSWSAEEDAILVEAQARYGNSWTKIAKLLPGRSENTVKNRWNSAARRKAKTRSALPGGDMQLRMQSEFGGNAAAATMATGLCQGSVGWQQPSLPLQLQVGGTFAQGQPNQQQHLQLALIQQPSGQLQYVVVPSTPVPTPQVQALQGQTAPGVWLSLNQLPGAIQPPVQARYPVNGLQAPMDQLGQMKDASIPQISSVQQGLGLVGVGQQGLGRLEVGQQGLRSNTIDSGVTLGSGIALGQDLTLSQQQQRIHQVVQINQNGHLVTPSTLASTAVNESFEEGRVKLMAKSHCESIGRVGAPTAVSMDTPQGCIQNASLSSESKADTLEGEDLLSLSIFNMSLDQSGIFNTFTDEVDGVRIDGAVDGACRATQNISGRHDQALQVQIPNMQAPNDQCRVVTNNSLGIGEGGNLDFGSTGMSHLLLNSRRNWSDPLAGSQRKSGD